MSTENIRPSQKAGTAEDRQGAGIPAESRQLSGELLHILQHALGLDKYGQGEMYRNHFCASGDDEPLCRQLVDMGYMYVFRPNASPYPYYNCAVTDAGKQAVREQSPKPPKLTRSQQRYRRFLQADTGGSFREWLQDQREAGGAA